MGPGPIDICSLTREYNYQMLSVCAQKGFAKSMHVPTVPDGKFCSTQLDAAHLPELVPVRLRDLLLGFTSNGRQKCLRRLDVACDIKDHEGKGGEHHV
jgi:hypothetical protein